MGLSYVSIASWYDIGEISELFDGGVGYIRINSEAAERSKCKNYIFR